ncbi:MAG: hypothetical protein AYK19_07575 [Theionarchaea archaeon DG-70-1]|nr:MAG: hypothetical protein AYK19_07575 [Theionarchaea archaeon DG-70-1]
MKRIWRNPEDYCISQDKPKDKNIELFRQKFKEKLDNKDYNFQDYCFLEKVDFSYIKFDKEVDFSRTIFQKDADFTKATFQKDANFNEATFQKNAFFNQVIFKNAYFDKAIFQQNAVFIGSIFQSANFHEATFRHHADFLRATFQKDANFDETTFQKDASFNRVIFQNVSFDKAIFQYSFFDNSKFKNCFFIEAKFKFASFYKSEFQDVFFNKSVIEQNLKFISGQVDKLNLQNTQFLFKGYMTANLAQTKFHGADMENLAFVDCDWPKKIYEEIHMKDEQLSFKDLETVYRNLKQNMQRHGDYSKAGEFFYREMEMKRKGAEKKRDRLWFLLYYLLAGYGERPQRTLFMSVLAVLAFALLYLVLGCLQYAAINPCFLQKIIDAFYFSFVTFTTLGLGDIRPATTMGKALICCEAVIGAFLIALFVVVFVRKMAR